MKNGLAWNRLVQEVAEVVRVAIVGCAIEGFRLGLSAVHHCRFLLTTLNP
jgi:hypothetical protein